MLTAHQLWLEAPYRQADADEAAGEAWDAAKAELLPEIEDEIRKDGDAVADLVHGVLQASPASFFLTLSVSRDSAEFGAQVARLLDAAIAEQADKIAEKRMQAARNGW